MIRRCGSPAASSRPAASATWAGAKFGPPDPPRRMRERSGFPVVATSAAFPSASMPRKDCGAEAALSASSATWIPPSVPFLNPIGIDSPEASWRWICDSVVRAPIAPQLTRSAMYWGLIGSRNSVAAGRPSAVTSRRKARAVRRPAAMSWEPSRCGSLIRPFQPTVVRGFSK